tara:strand:- start:13 stop:297 length:285 start_codon:yes stop_codon:yes gene_type:complete
MSSNCHYVALVELPVEVEAEDGSTHPKERKYWADTIEEIADTLIKDNQYLEGSLDQVLLIYKNPFTLDSIETNDITWKVRDLIKQRRSNDNEIA